MPTPIMVCTRSNCARLAIGPCVVLCERGSPTTISAVSRREIARPRPAARAARSCASARCTTGRGCAWPAATAAGMARDRDRRRAGCRFGDLPPSSCATRLTVGAAACATSTPARVEPVIEIMSTSGCVASAAPTSGPSPWTRLKTPAGTPASCIDFGEQQRAQRRELAGLQHDGAARGERRARPWR